MNQSPRTIQQQIAILKSRGMAFSDENLATSYLTRISYFRLKYYWTDMIDVATGHYSDDAWIWYRIFSKKPTNIRGHRYKWMVQDMTEHQRKRAFGVISCLLYLCNAIKPDNTVKDDIKDLFCSMPDVPVFMIGFTRGWDNNPLWK